MIITTVAEAIKNSVTSLDFLYSDGVYFPYMRIIESRLFAKQVDEYLKTEEYAAFRLYLAQHPDAGDIMPSGGGIRKVRWGAKGKGKSGGVRIIYYHYTIRAELLLMLIYSKGEMGNISPEMLKRLRKEL